MQITQSSDASVMSRLTSRFGSYSGAGVGTFIFDLVLIWILIYSFQITEPVAIGVAFLIAVHANYAAQRFWVYRHTPEKLPKTYFYFITLAIAFTFILPTLVVWFEGISGLGMFTSRVLVGAAIGVLGFLFNTFINFKLL